MMPPKPKLIIAGPGSGKTHNLVDEIINCITTLEPNRVLAAITYTNAATHSIKTKLEKRIKIPPNVFIGTTYSFFNSFILLPYASLFGLVDFDKLFIEYDIIEKAKQRISKKTFSSVAEKARYQKTVQSDILKGLLTKGVIPFEEIAKISSSLIINKRIRFIVGNKIQYLFVDEFQDATSHQFKIFDEIRKEKKSTLYLVGDPEQYISNFTIKGKSIPKFHKIPIMTFKMSCDVNQHVLNRRSTKQVVDFINNFNTQLQQESFIGSTDLSKVHFISEIKLDSIVQIFLAISKPIEQKDSFSRFYLALANNTFEAIRQKYSLSTISNEHVKSENRLSESLKIISAATGLSGRKICFEYGLDNIDYRVMGISVLKKNFNSIDEFKNFLSEILKLKLTNDVNFERLFERVKDLNNRIATVRLSELTSSIHKSKGLEADAVLVVARTNNELSKWLETNQLVRYSDKTDSFRLGFVAFSRAKEILCIACLQKIDDKNRQKLVQLKVSGLAPSSLPQNLFS